MNYNFAENKGENKIKFEMISEIVASENDVEETEIIKKLEEIEIFDNNSITE